MRARINLSGPLTDRDPRTALEIARTGLEQARRLGHRQGESMLIGNSSVGAIETGAWDWARTEVRTGLEEANSEEERTLLMQFLVHLLVEGGANADAELDETDAWFAERVADEPYLASAMAGNRAFRAIQAATSRRRRRRTSRPDDSTRSTPSPPSRRHRPRPGCTKPGVVADEASRRCARRVPHAAAALTLRPVDAVSAAVEGRLDTPGVGILGDVRRAFAGSGPSVARR